jgi:hypothetical protein
MYVLTVQYREVCRRARAKEQAKMQTAMADYRSKVKAKERKRGGISEDDGKTHAPAVGGVLMGQKGQAMLEEKRAGSSPDRLV